MKKRTKPFDQHLYHDIENEEETYLYTEKSLPLIGYIVMHFNGLEKELDSVICEIFTDRTDSTGLIVLHKMNYAAKVDLFKRFNDELLAYSDWNIESYQSLITNLKECGRLRNLVVHADWENTDDDGYTYVSLKITKGDMSQEYVQFSIDSLEKINNLILSTRAQLEFFWEERNSKLYDIPME